MNQQQATEFVTQALQRGIAQAQIVQVLSRQLGAPPEITERFVAQVAAQTRAVPVAPDKMPLPDTPASPPAVEPAPAPPAAAPVSDSAAQPVQERYPVQKTEQPPARYPIQKDSQPTSVQPRRRAGHLNPILEDPALKAEVLARLKRQQRKSDIAMFVCESVSVEWSEAQRFVNQVEVENHQSLTARRQLPVLFLSLLFIIGGIALIYSGVSMFSPEMRRSVPLSSSSNSLQILMLGLALLVGGVVGVIQSWRSMS